VRKPASALHCGPFVLAGAAWLFAALILVVLAPLDGGVAATYAAFAGIVIVPGLLTALALRLHPSWTTPWLGVTTSLALGAGIAVPVAWTTRAIGLPLEIGAYALVGMGLPLLAAIGWLARRDALPGFEGLRGRTTSEWSADVAVAFGAALLATTFALYLEPFMRSGDLWVYLSYIDWMVDRPGLDYQPHSVDPDELNHRLQTSGFLALEAMLTRVMSPSASALEVFWSWLPAVLLPTALIAQVSLAAALRCGPITRIALVLAQLALVYATYGYVIEPGASGGRWAGATWFLRISQDKVFLLLQLVPAVAVIGVQWLDSGRTRWLAALLIVGAGCVMTHPLGLPFAAMVVLPYAALTALSGETSWRRVGTLVLVLLPLIAWPLTQRASEAVPNTLADAAGFERREHGTRDTLDIRNREENRFTANVSLISHRLVIAGILSGGLLGFAARRRRDARYAFATTAAPLAMLYTPGIAPLAGLIVTPYLLWRFIWLLPLALSLAVGLTVTGSWLARRAARALPGHTRLAQAAATTAFVAAVVLLTRLPSDLTAARDLLHRLTPAPISAEVGRPLMTRIHARVGDEERLLLDPTTQQLAVALAEGMQTAHWRWGSNQDLHHRIGALFTSPFLAREHVELLRELDIAWLALHDDHAIREDVARRSNAFEYVETIGGFQLFRVVDLTNETTADTLLGHWQLRLREEPDSPEVLVGLAGALASRGRIEEAKASLRRALAIGATHAGAHAQLGTLLLYERRFGRAAEHLSRAIELDPEQPTTLNNLVWLLATVPEEPLRNPARAVELADQLEELATPDAAALDTIAAARAAHGDFAEAIGYAQRALEIYRAAGYASEVAGVERRLALYRSGRAYIDTAD